MAGGAKGSSSSHNKSHHHSSSSSSHHNNNNNSRKSRWENDKKPNKNPNPSPKQPTPKTNPPTLHNHPPTLQKFQNQPPSFENLQNQPPSYENMQNLPPPQPSYGFHMLERCSIVLADGSVRSYFALPEGYDFGVQRGGGGFGPMSPEMVGRNEMMGFGAEMGPGMGMGMGMGKRKYEDEREVAWQRQQQLLHFGNAGTSASRDFSGMNPHPGPSNPRELAGLGGGDEFRMAKQMRVGGGYQGSQVTASVNKHNEVDQSTLKKAFLHFVKLINENANQKKLYLENGKQGPLNCVVCGRSGRDFPDMHALIMHTYNPDRADQLVDHLGLHKALCLLMGWNYSRAPDNSKAYQSLSADEAAANQDDVILWPPMVVVHNTITGKGKEGRMDGLGNKAMDAKMRELGFASGKAKSVYGKEGHLGISLIKFPADQSGLKDAVRLADFFKREKRGRKVWSRVQPSSTMGKDDENNPNLMELDKKTGEKQRILYGYLGTVFDLDKLDFDTRKKIQIETRRDHGAAK